MAHFKNDTFFKFFYFELRCTKNYKTYTLKVFALFVGCMRESKDKPSVRIRIFLERGRSPKGSAEK